MHPGQIPHEVVVTLGAHAESHSSAVAFELFPNFPAPALRVFKLKTATSAELNKLRLAAILSMTARTALLRTSFNLHRRIDHSTNCSKSNLSYENPQSLDK